MERDDRKIDVSIIIVNYNTINLLTNAIDSVIEKTIGITYEIIVVDNNSDDDSEQVLAQKYGDIVCYVKLLYNVGFGRANNEGFKLTRGRNVLCLNPDTILINNAVRVLSIYLDENPMVAVVGSQLYNRDGSLQRSYSSYYLSLSSMIHDLFGSVFRRIPSKIEYPTDVATVYGASMMIRHDVIDITNGFNPKFFMYAEEEEWCYRINKLKYRIVCVPQSKVTHLDGGSFQFSQERSLRRIEGRRMFFKEVYSPLYFKFVQIIDLLISVTRIAIFGLLGNGEKVKFWKFYYRNRL